MSFAPEQLDALSTMAFHGSDESENISFEVQSPRLDRFLEPMNSQTEMTVDGSVSSQTIRYPRWRNIGEEPIIIAVMGISGVGKSNLITAMTKWSSNTALSCSWGEKYLDLHKTKHSTTRVDRPDFLFIDTPGFDSTSRDDTETLNEIARWLSDAYGDVSRISGLMYLQQLSLDQSRIRDQLFRKYIMEENLHRRSTLTTLAWQQLEEGRKIKRLGDFNEDQVEQIVLECQNHAIAWVAERAREREQGGIGGFKENITLAILDMTESSAKDRFLERDCQTESPNHETFESSTILNNGTPTRFLYPETSLSPNLKKYWTCCACTVGETGHYLPLASGCFVSGNGVAMSFLWLVQSMKLNTTSSTVNSVVHTVTSVFPGYATKILEEIPNGAIFALFLLATAIFTGTTVAWGVNQAQSPCAKALGCFVTMAGMGLGMIAGVNPEEAVLVCFPLSAGFGILISSMLLGRKVSHKVDEKMQLCEV